MMSDGLRVRIFPGVRAKSTMLLTSGASTLTFWNRRRDPATDCVTTLSGDDLRTAARQTLAGVETVAGVRTVKFVSQESPRVEQWYAPAYGCALVQQVAHFSFPSGVSTTVLESSEPGAPGAAYFDQEPGFEEVPPSRLHARVAEKLKGRAESCNPKADEVEDRRYYSSRP